jgi:hypothetical protein
VILSGSYLDLNNGTPPTYHSSFPESEPGHSKLLRDRDRLAWYFSRVIPASISSLSMVCVRREDALRYNEMAYESDDDLMVWLEACWDNRGGLREVRYSVYDVR